MTVRADAGPGAAPPGRAFDAASLLLLYLLLVFAIESRLTLPGLGAVGQPALLVALVGLVWWVHHHLQRGAVSHPQPHPVRLALLVVLVAFLASYAAAMSRPITPNEFSTAQIGLVGLLGIVGVALLAHDGIPDLRRFDIVVRRLVLLTTLLAVLGIAQMVAGDPLIRRFTIPGLVQNVPLGGITSRSGFSRPFGTALHPLEFGAVLTMVLPIAITRARCSTRPLVLRWSPVLLIALAVTFSISRSAVVCGLVGMLVLASGWTRRERQYLAAGLFGVLLLVAATVPGMLGSISGLFTSAGDDGSVASRTGSYPMALQLVTTAPLFGRGYSTFLPSYRIFDNQYLLLVVEVGAVGLLSVLALVAAGIWSARRVRSLSTDTTVTETAHALQASLAAGTLGLAFFDGFSFPMCTGVLFLLFGLTGALLRLTRESSLPTPPGDETGVEDTSGPPTTWHQRPLARPLAPTAGSGS